MKETIEIRIMKAIRFARIAYGEQKRKYTNEPYLHHCLDVAHLVTTVSIGGDITIAAILHDTLEDTNTTVDDIRRGFGDGVAKLVIEVTDVSKPSDGNRKVRKALDREHLAKASPEGKTIKLADLIDNSLTITRCDPDFAKVYMQEKRELLEVLREGSTSLWREAKKIVDNYFSTEEKS
jgi:(p)ppGpp synthase/HD superfamily hydrolase